MNKPEITSQSWYKTTMDTAKATVAQFIELIENKKDKEALEFYLKEQGSFFVAFELTTDSFEFHSNIVIPLFFKYKESAIAYKEAIRILEMEQTLTEAVIIMSGSTNIPTHYGRLISELEQLYTAIGCYENALVQTDRILNVTDDMEAQALVYNNKAYIYKLMGNKAAAIKSAKKAISILKELKQQDNEMYSNCQEIIAEIKGKSKKNNLLEKTYCFQKYIG